MSLVTHHFALKEGRYNCKYCDRKFTFSSSGNTSSRLKHLRGKHPEKLLETTDRTAPELPPNPFFRQTEGSSELNKAIIRLFAQLLLQKYQNEDNGTETQQEVINFDQDVVSENVATTGELFEWIDFGEESEVAKAYGLKEEILDYIKEPRLEVPLPKRNNFKLVLDFWRNRKSKYPRLCKLAKMYLSLSASSSEPERVFSNLTNLFQNTQPNRLDTTSVENLMTIRNQMIVKKAEKNIATKPLEDLNIFEVEEDGDNAEC